MNDKARRRQLTAEYKRTHPEAGVYRIVNRQTQKSLLGSSPNLNGVRGKIDFARSTNMPGALDHRLAADIRRYGLDAFEIEILEVLETRPEMTQDEIRADLQVLEGLWRERFDSELLY